MKTIQNANIARKTLPKTLEKIRAEKLKKQQILKKNNFDQKFLEQGQKIVNFEENILKKVRE